MRLVFLGPPGAGKGTQASMLSKRLGVPHISTGDMLRSAVSNGTELGKLAKSYIDEGKLVPDEVIVDMIKERLSKPDAQRGFILDGFPRTIAQAEALDSLLNGLNMPLNAVIYLNVGDEEIVERLLKRGRSDDTKEVIEKRLKVYRKQTAPLIDYYSRKCIISEINGVGSLSEIQSKIEGILR